jgi:hypothetical protein
MNRGNNKYIAMLGSASCRYKPVRKLRYGEKDLDGYKGR